MARRTHLAVHPKLLRRMTVAIVTISMASAPSLVRADDGVDPRTVEGVAKDTPRMERATAAGLRDVGRLLGLSPVKSSYTVVTRDIDDDGWADVFIGHHGAGPAELYMNENDGSRSLGLVRVATFKDTLHDRTDRHGCTIADVNLDGLDDIFCAKGARTGTAIKWNELWMQEPEGVWTDRAHAFGVEDIWGRGRFPRFMDLNHDRWPDLFIGNNIPRKDEHVTPNRTYINKRGRRFHQVKLGVTRQIGDTCTAVADYDRNGWQDLLVCGLHRLYLYRRVPGGFKEVTARVGLSTVEPRAASFAHLNRDHRLDLVITTARQVQVRLQRPDHTFGPASARFKVQFGHGLTVGDPDGDGDDDIYVVEGCVGGVNMDDWLLVNAGGGQKFGMRRVARVSKGCGDTAATLDFDHDGLDDFVVLNGGGMDQPHILDGPDQLLTLGGWVPSP